MTNWLSSTEYMQDLAETARQKDTMKELSRLKLETMTTPKQKKGRLDN